MDDLISRIAIIDKMDEWDWQEFYLPIQFKELLDELPTFSICTDAISRKQVIKLMQKINNEHDSVYATSAIHDVVNGIEQLPSVSVEKIGLCKDCKWWKDSDGVFRRGVRAESKCPIGRREVYEGNGYCYMFEPQESEVKNETCD